MPPMGGPRRQSFLTEEEKKNRPKVTKVMLNRIFLLSETLLETDDYCIDCNYYFVNAKSYAFSSYR